MTPCAGVDCYFNGKCLLEVISGMGKKIKILMFQKIQQSSFSQFTDAAFTSYLPACKCFEGYSGQSCEKDPCSDDPCNNNGKCTINFLDFGSGSAAYECDCYEGFSGENCEKTPCSEDPCNGHGECSLLISDSKIGFECSCQTGFSGSLCQNDPCLDSPCKNGGNCLVDKDSYLCECKKGKA